jgi:hypothetical protein
MGKNMLKQTSINKIFESLTSGNKIILLENNYYFYALNNHFMIFNQKEIQESFNNINTSELPIYNNNLDDFLNGRFSFSAVNIDKFKINKHIYKQMKINFPNEILKLFEFSSNTTNLYVNCG